MPGIKQRFWGQFLSKKKKEEKKEDKKNAVTDATTTSSSVAAPVPLPDPPKKGRKRVSLGGTELNPLALQLKRDWLQQKQTSKGVQQYAEAAASSGSSGMASLAAAATEGMNSKNLARDMRRRLLLPLWRMGLHSIGWMLAKGLNTPWFQVGQIRKNSSSLKRKRGSGRAVGGPSGQVLEPTKANTIQSSHP